MKKAKKYVYPLLFSVGFLVCWLALCFIINEFFNGDGYSGLGWAMLILFAWLIFGLPMCCIKYSKIIAGEKLRFLFCAYNSLMIIAFHILPFNLRGYIAIIVFFAFWVLLWNIVPLICQINATKHKEDI